MSAFFIACLVCALMLALVLGLAADHHRFSICLLCHQLCRRLRLVNQRARAANHCVRTLYHTPRCLSVQSIRWQKRCAVFADIFWHRAKVCITKAEISMCTWRSPTRAASQGVFVVIPEISHSDISSIKKPHADMYLSWGFGVYALVNRR